jgi:hypothetical protein
MWSTSWEGVKLAAMAYLLPLLWCYNPALLLDGSWSEIGYAIGTALVAATLMAKGMQGGWRGRRYASLISVGVVAAAIAAGGSTVWFGANSPFNLVSLCIGIGLFVLLRHPPGKAGAASASASMPGGSESSTSIRIRVSPPGSSPRCA